MCGALLLFSEILCLVGQTHLYCGCCIEAINSLVSMVNLITWFRAFLRNWPRESIKLVVGSEACNLLLASFVIFGYGYSLCIQRLFLCIFSCFELMFIAWLLLDVCGWA